MPDYSKGKIYTIRCRTDNSLIYVGSTTQPLYKRWDNHKTNKKDTEISKKVNGDWDNWYIELLIDHPCENREQLVRKEGEYIRSIGNINKNVAGRTRVEYKVECKDKIIEYNEKTKEQKKEYREKNKDKINEKKKLYREQNKEKIAEKNKKYREKNKEKLLEKKKEYREKNKEKINEKIICECGCEISKKSLWYHKNTKKHINYKEIYLTPNI
jgi:hypothetical protein